MLPVMLWLDVKLMLSDFALGNAKPESDSPPLPVATNEVALTTPLTVRPVSVPILDVATELLANLSALTAPLLIFASVTLLDLR